jgi:hypothetical protein
MQIIVWKEKSHLLKGEQENFLVNSAMCKRNRCKQSAFVESEVQHSNTVHDDETNL